MSMRILKVPGNLLLLGEYAILEEGGLGIAMAIDRKIIFSMEKSDSFEIKGKRGNKSSHWKPEKPETDHFIDTIYRETLKAFKDDSAVERIQRYKITIDSSSHHAPTGKKYGFGSSAVIACGLTQLLFYLAGMEDDAEYRFNKSLQSHRQAQGDRGSGYDVAASFNGGIGLFCGGKNPVWKPLELPWLPPGYIFPGPETVSTVSSVKKYQAFKSENNMDANKFYSFSNEMVEQFIQAEGWKKGMGILKQYREESIRFQKKLDIDASTPPLPDFKGQNENWIIKSLGAGNELGSLWGEIQINDKNKMLPFCLSKTGPEWV